LLCDPPIYNSFERNHVSDEELEAGARRIVQHAKDLDAQQFHIFAEPPANFECIDERKRMFDCLNKKEGKDVSNCFIYTDAYFDCTEELRKRKETN
jgi:hypothetical protein